MLNMNKNQILEQVMVERQRICHDIATQSRRIRAEKGLLSEIVSIQSGGVLTSKTLERIELERIRELPLSLIIALGLVLGKRVKIEFVSMPGADNP